MKKEHVLLLSLGVFIFSMCKTQMDIPAPEKIRQVKPLEVSSYHPPILLTIAWYPYEDLALRRTAGNEWKVVESDSANTGEIPVILITYPDSQDTLWLEMNTSNEMLGKLLKHSLMTQMPIQEPIGNFLETAKCQSCHPPEVQVDFNK